MIKPGKISWRYILWCLAELPEGEWISPEQFSNLYSVPHSRTLGHFKNLRRWGHISRRPAPELRKIRGGRFCKYQITPSAREKVDFWRKIGKNIDWQRKRIECPQCGFFMNIPELEFLYGMKERMNK